MREKINLHLFLSAMVSESRLSKEARYTVKNNVFDRVVVLGLWSDGLPRYEKGEDLLEIRRAVTMIKKYKSIFKFGWMLPLRKIMAAMGFLEYFFQALKVSFLLGPTHISCHNLQLLPFAWLVGKFVGAELVYVPHELETQRAGLSEGAKKISAWIENLWIRKCKAIVVVCEPIAQWYRNQYRIDNVYVVRNLPESKNVIINRTSDNNFRNKYGVPDDALIFIYQGLIGRERGALQLLEAFSRLPQGKKHHLVLMGYSEGDFDSVIKSYENAFDNIHYHPAVPMAEIISYTSSADVGVFVLCGGIPLSYAWSLPNKFYEYLHAQLPVIVSSNLEYLTSLVAEQKIGWITSPDGFSGMIGDIAREDIEGKKGNIKNYSKECVWEADAVVFKKVYA